MCSYKGRSLTAVTMPLPPAHIFRVIWICVEISKRIYKNKKSQWGTDQHRLMSRTPCNAVAEHQGTTDPWLKTPALGGMPRRIRCSESSDLLFPPLGTVSAS